MNCAEARRYWSLYYDSEGDADLHYRIGEHLANCPGCARWFDRQNRLEVLLAEKLRGQGPSPAIWDRVLGQTGLGAKPVAARRWSRLLGLAACLLLGVTVSWIFLQPVAFAARDLANLSSAWHQRLEAGEETLQFRSESDLEVERYLRQRVPFPVRCPPRRDTGFAVQGAGGSGWPTSRRRICSAMSMRRPFRFSCYRATSWTPFPPTGLYSKGPRSAARRGPTPAGSASWPRARPVAARSKER
ncbi:MAG: hypothetical protein EA424_03000 [Planctomycetaceae bacterium]|nr:MAG: hypothetical protein EA424_03000 [Planctomycetaceae bacterium]